MRQTLRTAFCADALVWHCFTLVFLCCWVRALQQRSAQCADHRHRVVDDRRLSWKWCCPWLPSAALHAYLVFFSSALEHEPVRQRWHRLCPPGIARALCIRAQLALQARKRFHGCGTFAAQAAHILSLLACDAHCGMVAKLGTFHYTGLYGVQALCQPFHMC